MRGSWSTAWLLIPVLLASCATTPQKMNDLMGQGRYVEAIEVGQADPHSDTPEIAALLEKARREQPGAYVRWAKEGVLLERKGDLDGAVAAWNKAIAARPSDEGEAALRRLAGKQWEDREQRLLTSDTALIDGYHQALAAHPPEDTARATQKALDDLTQNIVDHADDLLNEDEAAWAERFLGLVASDPEAQKRLKRLHQSERRDLLSHPLEPDAPLKVRMEEGEPEKNLPHLPTPRERGLDELERLHAKGDFLGIRKWLDRNGDKGWIDTGRQQALEQRLISESVKLMSRADAAFVAEDLPGAVELARRAVTLDPSVPQNRKRLKEWEGMLENLRRLQDVSP